MGSDSIDLVILTKQTVKRDGVCNPVTHVLKLLKSPNVSVGVANPDRHRSLYAYPENLYVRSEGLYACPESLDASPKSRYACPESLYASPKSLYASPKSLYASPESLYARPENLYVRPESRCVRPESLDLPVQVSCLGLDVDVTL